MLKKLQKEKLNFWDINTLNQRIVKKFCISGAFNTIIMMQNNRTYHLINCPKIAIFEYANNWHIITFLVKYYQIKKDGDNLIHDKLLFKAQNGEKNCIGSGLLFYYRKIFVYLLVN